MTSKPIKHALVGLGACALFACLHTENEAARSASPESAPVSATLSPRAPEVDAEDAAVETYSPTQICKAGIGLLMGRDPLSMNAREAAGIVVLSYVRSDDGTKWAYRCRLGGDRIVWSSDTGRWRTHPADEVLRYAVNGNGDLVVTETYSDGSMTSKAFTATALGP